MQVHSQPVIDYVITTVPRRVNYIEHLISSLPQSLQISVVVGSTEFDYLNNILNRKFINVQTPSKRDWDYFINLDVHHRASWNYWRCLSLGMVNPDSDGLLVFEDDITPCRSWHKLMKSAISKLDSIFGSRYVLALYCSYLHVSDNNINGVAEYYIPDFYGMQAIYYPNYVRSSFADYLYRYGVLSYRTPYDLLLKEFLLKYGIPLFCTVPSLFQHIGQFSTGLGSIFHQAPDFHEDL